MRAGRQDFLWPTNGRTNNNENAVWIFTNNILPRVIQKNSFLLLLTRAQTGLNSNPPPTLLLSFPHSSDRTSRFLCASRKCSFPVIFGERKKRKEKLLHLCECMQQLLLRHSQQKKGSLQEWILAKNAGKLTTCRENQKFTFSPSHFKSRSTIFFSKNRYSYYVS